MIESILTLKDLPDVCDPSHKLRGSDSSFYDVKCVYCGRHDNVPGGWGQLRVPCDGDKSIEKF